MNRYNVSVGDGNVTWLHKSSDVTRFIREHHKCRKIIVEMKLKDLGVINAYDIGLIIHIASAWFYHELEPCVNGNLVIHLNSKGLI